MNRNRNLFILALTLVVALLFVGCSDSTAPDATVTGAVPFQGHFDSEDGTFVLERTEVPVPGGVPIPVELVGSNLEVMAEYEIVRIDVALRNAGSIALYPPAIVWVSEFFPNTVRVLDFGSEGELHYLVMEYLDGFHLGRYLSRQKRFTLKEAVAIMSQICGALAAAHDRERRHVQELEAAFHKEALGRPRYLLEQIREIVISPCDEVIAGRLQPFVFHAAQSKKNGARKRRLYLLM